MSGAAEAGDGLAEQYSRWVYPRPIADLRAACRNGERCPEDPTLMHWAYWPAGGYPRDLRILVAGCGANQAAITAFHNPRAQVTGIDLAGPSLEHESLLKQRHGLTNLSLQQLALEDVASLSQEFDLIVASGVLHHLEDPVRGLRALGGVLSAEGVISMMLYGKHGRAGVYMLQELFRLLEIPQTADGVELVKSCLGSLGPGHPARMYLRNAPDLGFDAGIVDTFLHRRDRAYTVSDCLELVRASGLVFQGWQENYRYYPDGHVPADSPIFQRMSALAEPARWQAVELFFGLLGQHSFFACRADRPTRRYRLSFAGAGFLESIPVPRISRALPPDPGKSVPMRIQREPFPPISLNEAQAALFRQIDGRRSVEACLESAGIQCTSSEREAFASQFLGAMWRFGYLFLRLP